MQCGIYKHCLHALLDNHTCSIMIGLHSTGVGNEQISVAIELKGLDRALLLNAANASQVCAPAILVKYA